MLHTLSITRKSRNIGFGYTCWTPEHPEQPSQPDYTGTPKTVLDKIANDRTYKSFKSGGTYYTSQWFAKINGKWTPIKFDDGFNLADLYIEMPSCKFDGSEYMANVVYATYETNDAAAALGKLGGSKTTTRKAAASRENGRKGGRPRNE